MSSCWADEIWGKKSGEYAHSARGEDCPPRYDETRDEFLSAGEEYSYIFTSAGWVCYDMNEFNDKEVLQIWQYEWFNTRLRRTGGATNCPPEVV